MGRYLRTKLGQLVGLALAGLLHIVTAPRIQWRTRPPGGGPQVYFANHTSNGHTVLIWAALPPPAIKRDRGVEDWSHTNDGQGGFIDRLDSIIFAAPVFST